MEEKQILIDKAEPVLLFGYNDSNLKQIERAFPRTRITARGNKVFLRGPKESVSKIDRVVTELTVLLNRNGNLTENDVNTVLRLSETEAFQSKTGADSRNTILFTPTGGSVRARTVNQVRLVEMVGNNDIVFAIGPAGTGKTYTAVALAVAALKSKRVKRIVLSRPAVEAGERLGFLPGDLREKVDPYLRPLYDALEDMLAVQQLNSYMEQNILEIVPLAYMRGRTLDSAFVILDEAQNATALQMKMFLTRLGAASQAIVTGDLTQTDLPPRETSGLDEAREVLGDVEGIEFVYFGEEDVVRHRLVKDIIHAYTRFHDSAGEYLQSESTG